MSQDTNKYVLAWFLGAGYFAAIMVLVFFEVKEGSAQIVNIMTDFEYLMNNTSINIDVTKNLILQGLLY